MVNKMSEIKKPWKDSYPLSRVLNTSFRMNQSPTFPSYNSYMSLALFYICIFL